MTETGIEAAALKPSEQIEVLRYKLFCQLRSNSSIENCQATWREIETLCRPAASGDLRERIARIVDPHSFCDIPFTDDPALLDMVEQSKDEALHKADAILAALDGGR